MFTGTCLAALCAVTLSAQTPAGQPPASSSQDSMKTVTVTGCLRAGEQPSTFVLSNAKWDKSGADRSTSATGTSGTSASASASAAAGSSVRLVGAPAGVQLTEHIGHTVEVTGMVHDKDKAPAPPAAGTGGEQTGKSKSDKPEPTLDVRTVKMISSSCDAK